MKDLDKIKYLLKLKEIERMGIVGNRMESSAEHSWACIIFGEYFINKYKIKINKNKVKNLLLYHDLIEIESGDIFILDEKNLKGKSEKELESLKVIKKKIPRAILKDYLKNFIEFEKCKTKEAKFAQAIDKIEPIVHWLEKKDQWIKYGFSEKILRDKKQQYIEPFPELMKFFDKLIELLKKNGSII